MEFNEKLQELRKQNNLTQEQLANALFVSRTAISKWESARGYPSIDSLKEISKYFSISLDDLLSTEETLTIAKEDTKQKIYHLRDIVFGLLDCLISSFFFLPLFGLQSGNTVEHVSFLSLHGHPTYITIPYFVIIVVLIVCGVLILTLQNYSGLLWMRIKWKLSLWLSVCGLLFFTMSRQPYAAAFVFMLLIIKTLMLIKWD